MTPPKLTSDQARRVIRHHYRARAERADETTLRRLVAELADRYTAALDWYEAILEAQPLQETAHAD